MEDYLELMENPTNYYSRQRSVMKKAAKLRREGYDASSALSMAWGNENPTSKAAVSPSSLTWVLLAGAAFVIGWRIWKKSWPWAGLGRPKMRRVIPVIPYPTNQNRETTYSLIVP